VAFDRCVTQALPGVASRVALANDTDVITLGEMGDTVWWSCAGCGSYAELPAVESEGFDLTCPDCAAELVPQWVWDDREPSAA